MKRNKQTSTNTASKNVTQRCRDLLGRYKRVIILLIAIVGVIGALSASAAVYSISIEAESGALEGGVTAVSDSSASGGSYARFSSTSTSPSVGKFQVVGKDIIGPDGKRFVPVGANVAPSVKNYPQWAFYNNNGWANGHANDAVVWGWNMVRLNVITDLPSDVTIQDMINSTFEIIDEYTAKGIVVMPDSHSVTGTNSTMTDQRYQNINTFWDAILSRYKDNPYVWVNYVNEPATEFARDSSLWKQLGDQQYQRVRERAPDKIFVYDLPIWGQSINELAESNIGEEFLAGKNNVVFSWHNYGGAVKPGWVPVTYNDMSQWAQAVNNKGLPVIIGEFGRSSQPNTPNVDGLNGAQVDLAADWVFDTWWQYGFGGLWWHGSSSPPNNWSLRMNIAPWYDESSPISASGTRLRAIPGLKPNN